MKRFIFMVMALMMGVTFTAQAQMDQQLPADPAVRKGVLENGLTYCIIFF